MDRNSLNFSSFDRSFFLLPSEEEEFGFTSGGESRVFDEPLCSGPYSAPIYEPRNDIVKTSVSIPYNQPLFERLDNIVTAPHRTPRAILRYLRLRLISRLYRRSRPIFQRMSNGSKEAATQANYPLNEARKLVL